MDISSILNQTSRQEKNGIEQQRKWVSSPYPVVVGYMEEPKDFLSKEEKLYYSICFEQYFSLSFYGNLLQKVFTFAQTFDEGSLAYRDRVWTILDALLQMKLYRDKDLYFSQLMNKWLLNPTINLFALELLYIAFMFVSSDVYITSNNNNGDSPPFSPFGHTIPQIMNQLRLLQYWAPKMDKLSLTNRNIIWNICKQIPLFDYYDQSSFRKTSLYG